MKQLVPVILIALVLFSCKDDEVSDTENPYAVAVGGKIYTIEQGADQTGARGQWLEEDIKVSITDFEGNPEQADLILELSDEDGVVYPSSYYNEEVEEGEEDWLGFKWKLGCYEKIQTLTISVNVCGVSRDGCFDALLFELIINTGTPSKGWAEVCFDFGNYTDIDRLTVHEDELLVFTNLGLFTTNDLNNNDWTEYDNSIEISKSTKIWHFENGEMLYESGHYLFLSETNGRSWESIVLPGYSSSYKRMTILSNGSYAGINESSGTVYLSNNKGNNWTAIIDDITDITGEVSSQVKDIVSEANKIYIITEDSRVIEYDDGTTTLHEFPSSSWDYRASMRDYYSLIQNGSIILGSSYGPETNILALNLTTDQVTSTLVLDDYNDYYMSEDHGNLFVFTENFTDSYHYYNNGAFSTIDANLSSNNSSYYFGQMIIFNGNPVYYSDAQDQLYYYND